MRILKTVAALIAAVTVLALMAPASASGSTERRQSQMFVLHGAGSTFDHPISVVATGPISGVGSFEIVDDRSGPEGDDFTAELVFPGSGTVIMEVLGQSSITFNGASCAGSQTGQFRWTITDGSGDFENASGSGTGTFTGRFVVRRGETGCVEDEPVVSVFVARLRGTASPSAAAAA